MHSKGNLYWRLMLLPPLASIVLAAVGFWPTRSMAGGGAVGMMLLAQGIVAGIALATLAVCMKRMIGREPQTRFQMVLLVGVIRLFVTIPVAWLVAYQYRATAAVFLLWVAITYFVMILVETLALIHWNKQLEIGQ